MHVTHFQPFPCYETDVLRVYREAEPDGIIIEDKCARVPLINVCIHRFTRILQNPSWDLLTQVVMLRDQNGGLLDIDCFTGVGTDGSTGHGLNKRSLKYDRIYALESFEDKYFYNRAYQNLGYRVFILLLTPYDKHIVKWLF